MAPEYDGEPGASSLKYDSDLLAVKPSTDVLVNGSAHAPGGRAAPQVPVSLRIGEVRKTLVVHGERVFYAGAGGIALTNPSPFRTCPIVYEAAFGGRDFGDADPRRHRLDARNPVGRGFATSASHLVDQPAYRVEYPSGDPSALGPAGFGPIDRAWSPRLGLAGTYDDAWLATRQPLLPIDYDERYALAAPGDQRLRGELRGGEMLEVVNMTPGGLLHVQLPQLALTFSTCFGPRREEHAARLTTVILEPDAPRLMMVWQASLRVRARDVDYLDETIVSER